MTRERQCVAPADSFVSPQVLSGRIVQWQLPKDGGVARLRRGPEAVASEACHPEAEGLQRYSRISLVTIEDHLVEITLTTIAAYLPVVSTEPRPR